MDNYGQLSEDELIARLTNILAVIKNDLPVAHRTGEPFSDNLNLALARLKRLYEVGCLADGSPQDRQRTLRIMTAADWDLPLMRAALNLAEAEPPRQPGRPAPATLDELIDEVARGDFSKWTVETSFTTMPPQVQHWADQGARLNNNDVKE